MSDICLRGDILNQLLYFSLFFLLVNILEFPARFYEA